MKLQTGKTQTRKKSVPPIIPFVALIVVFTIISIRYSQKNVSHETKSPSFFDGSSDNALAVTNHAEAGQEPCNDCNGESQTSPSETAEDKTSFVTETVVEAMPRGHADEGAVIPVNDNNNGRVVKVGPRKRSRRRSRRRQRRRDSTLTAKRNVTRTEGNDGVKALALEVAGTREGGSCDLFSGEWVVNPEGPYYTNVTCDWAIQEHQNCMKFGRPDTGFLKWRWKPDGCELPVFDPNRFLELVRGKSLAFVGDSVARNHMQSLLCLLSSVARPLDVSTSTDENFKRWEYREYDFNVSIFWSPYLVRTERTDPNDVTRPFNLFLDEFDESWTTQIQTFDFVIISAGHWFSRPTFFYLNGTLVGCQYCPQSNVSHLPSSFSYRNAFRTAFRAINGAEGFHGVTFLRTFAPSHFENGRWDRGGDCVRTRPFSRGEKALDDYNLEYYRIQLEELRNAQREGRRKGVKLRLFDATLLMLLRPDGHPGKYGRWPDGKVSVPNDCVHWCLPGPIDSWNDFLAELIRREAAVIRN
ncbi:unnamed protein product [Cuscuta epithymum]|uniref:Trichome birefringence-like N-terminal domain-containing protein n=1 Tax=Cuscuta epithymum TaxID=186058 RepID=A0AAV0D8X5_9ASTE|nr:unnamed protein product [Cuscuta epithymum]